MKYKLLTIILLICLASAFALAFIPIGKICDSATGCAVVYKSDYSTTFGVENSRLGFVAFIALLSITISHIVKPKKEKELAIIIGIFIASIIALYFIYLQIFVIKAICKYCMVVDIGSLLALFIILFYGRDSL